MKAVVATLVAFALVAIGALSATAAPRPTPSPARLVVTGVATPAAGVTVGATVDYTYSIWNTGGQAVIVTFGDALPSQVLPIEADPTQGSCSTDQQVICWLGSIGGGQRVTVTIATQVAEAGVFVNNVRIIPSDPSVPASVVGPVTIYADRATPVSYPAATKSARQKSARK